MASTSPAQRLTVPAGMQARVLGNPDELTLVEKPVPTAIKAARERIDDAIKVVVKVH